MGAFDEFSTIKEGCESYIASVVPKDASSVQITETKRAFFAGASYMLGLLHKLSRENSGIDYLIKLTNECHKFIDEQAKGGDEIESFNSAIEPDYVNKN